MVKSALWEVRAKWRDLGLELSMTVSTLDSIDIKERGVSGNCLREILAKWLRESGAGGPPRTWSSIIAALKEVDEMNLAESVEYHFGVSEVPRKSGELKHIIMNYCTNQAPSNANVISYLIILYNYYTVVSWINQKSQIFGSR